MRYTWDSLPILFMDIVVSLPLRLGSRNFGTLLFILSSLFTVLLFNVVLLYYLKCSDRFQLDSLQEIFYFGIIKNCINFNNFIVKITMS